MSEAKRTKGQLFVSAECKEIVVSEDSVYGVQVADCGQPAGDEYQPPIGEAEANAKFIVRACNSHDDLLSALRSLRNEIVGQLGIAREEIRAAISTTNLRCIECRVEESEAAIAKAEGR